MKLSDYLEARGETQVDFARRAGLRQSAISRACQGVGMRLATARQIVEASRKEPAPDGGTVTFGDLIPESEQEQGAA